MTYPRILVSHFTIEGHDQTYHLQVRLPRDCQRLVGVETSVRMLSQTQEQGAAQSLTGSFPIRLARQLGTLRLSQPGCIGQFYALAVKEENAAIGFADFSASDRFPSGPVSRGFQRLEDRIDVPRQASVVHGIYRDTSMRAFDDPVHYRVSLYLWYEPQKTELCLVD